MYYIKNGLNDGKEGIKGPFGWLAVLFCLGTLLSALITGGMIQSNSIMQTVTRSSSELIGLNIPPVLIGGFVGFLVFAVIIGGIKSIGTVAGRIVPFMAATYVFVALIVLIMYAENVPAAFGLIFSHAFGFEQAAGGAAGYGVMQAVRYGVARGLFSNEAGQGSAPMAHAAAQTGGPHIQGEIAMIGVFIDTVVICTMTALVLLCVNGVYPTEAGGTVEFVWQSDVLKASAMTNAVYATAIPFGGLFITFALFLFALTTMLGWSYYAETAATYVLGEKAVLPLKLFWIFVIVAGAAVSQTESLWRFGDISNAAMAIPNLIALILLSDAVIKIHNDSNK
jgi:AGCS family alanine or glycine:cation symporter